MHIINQITNCNISEIVIETRVEWLWCVHLHMHKHMRLKINGKEKGMKIGKQGGEGKGLA